MEGTTTVHPGLPTGTVTFLFTDIEGSTRLVNALGNEMWADMLTRHHSLVREALAECQGIEVATEGDSFFAVFTDAAAAVSAANSIQDRISSEDWPDDGVVRVRIGVHTGTAHRGGDNYVGVDIHRAARIGAAAHGSQVILSETTARLVSDRLPQGTRLDRLGRFRLADLQNAETLVQLSRIGREEAFPPPRGARSNSRLPRPLTEFVGRDRELATLREMVGKYPLVTLTGPGGTGKTRLAIETARAVQDDFPDGAVFVGLAQISESELLPKTVLDALGVETSASDPEKHLLAHLEDKAALLVLDNFEQILKGATLVARLLDTAPSLRVLATSRAPLRVGGEQEFPVPPLPTPDDAYLDPIAACAFESVQLFASRAAAVRPGFEVGTDNAVVVAAIAGRLDGLPLAIELAASRIRSLTPEVILDRLDNTLLSGGGADLPTRQQTIVDTIGWSYDLLDEPIRWVFERCSVFTSTFSLDAAERVCSDLGVDVIDCLSRLVEDSLLMQPVTSGEPRFRMLTVVREYGFAALVSRGEDTRALESMAGHYLQVAETAGRDILTSRRGSCLERLSLEHDDIRASIDFAIAHGKTSMALRFSSAMWRFWQMRGHIIEAEERVRRALELSGGDDQERAAALIALGGILYWQGLWTENLEPLQRAVELLEPHGESVEYADALYNLAFAKSSEPDEAERLLRESMRISASLNHPLGVARAYWGLSDISINSANWEQAISYGEEAKTILEKLDAPFDLGWCYFLIGFANERWGRYEEARRHVGQAVDQFVDPVDLSAITLILEALAGLLINLDEPFDAARLAGVARRLKVETGATIGDAEMNQMPRLTEFLASGDEMVVTGLEEGASMSVEEAIAVARGYAV